jgi:tetratricopeptide (TPR) repeat protein
MGRTVFFHRTLRVLSCIVAFAAATTVMALPVDSRAPDMAAVGAQIATIINERQADALAAMLDMNELGARVAGNVFENDSGRREFARGFTKTAKAKTLVGDFFGEMDRSTESAARFMRVVTRGTETRPLLRFDYGDDGFEYIEFVVRPDGKGGAKIIDWAPLSGGDLYSEIVGRMARILSEPAPGLIQTLLGMEQIDQETLKRMKAIGEMRRKGDLRSAYLEMEKLPSAIADSRFILVQRASLANESGDDAGYRKTLTRLEQLHGKDPAAAFMLLDHYFLTKDLDKCLQAITAIESRVGVDGMTQMLRSSIYMTLGKHQEAITYARKAIEVEPEMTTPYFTLAQSHVALGQFAEAVEVYTTLQEDFGYEFTKDNFVKNETFGKFVDSPSFRQWLHE